MATVMIANANENTNCWMVLVTRVLSLVSPHLWPMPAQNSSLAYRTGLKFHFEQRLKSFIAGLDEFRAGLALKRFELGFHERSRLPVRNRRLSWCVPQINISTFAVHFRSPILAAGRQHNANRESAPSRLGTWAGPIRTAVRPLYFPTRAQEQTRRWRSIQKPCLPVGSAFGALTHNHSGGDPTPRM